MATEIKVPDLGESIVEATVAEWLKQEGDAVQVGETLLVLETDKVDLDVGAETSGVLARIMRGPGEDVQVGDVLGVIEESAGAAPSKPAAQPESQAQPPAEKPAPATAPAESGTQQAEAAPAPAKEKVTPVARRMAEEHGIDPAQVQPSEPHGRVTKEDVERHLARRGDQPQAAPAQREAPPPAKPAPQPAGDGRREERVRMSRRRRTIAERLVEAQRTTAMLTTFNEVDMSSVMALRTRHKSSFEERHGTGLGIASFFVKAAVGALKAFPEVNAEIDEQTNEIVLKHYYDIGVAIGAPDGLVVPVIRNADRLSFAAIEQAIKDFAQRATDGTLTLEDLRGGTFTITNGGVFGSLLSTPILNPPQVGILGLHRIEQRPIALDGEVVIHPMMYVALSYDHRIIDGREAVQFLVRIKQLIEDPEVMLLEG